MSCDDVVSILVLWMLLRHWLSCETLGSCFDGSCDCLVNVLVVVSVAVFVVVVVLLCGSYVLFGFGV